ncbi:GNAT family N-acetyltransferase [Micromonospora siamensis]|uniref:GNAT family N-acetyltransferase n=1 Tax=Micromonospora siamensis TaxID=299152 RepID=UPI0012FDCC22|nr:GNAT family N-acetyltransferase [Micromonospora siamensis]
MSEYPEIETARLRLRQFRAEDFAVHRALVDDDSAVTWSHRRRPLAASLRSWADRIDGWQRNGFGMWIAEVVATREVIGHCGLQRMEGGDEVELGYYFGRAAWGQGYATEAARACLAYGFDQCDLPSIVAVVRRENAASRRVVQKVGMLPERDGTFYDADATLFRLTSGDFRR